MQREQRERVEAERRRITRLREWWMRERHAVMAAEITRYAQEVDQRGAS
jgi:hypothetical protein